MIDSTGPDLRRQGTGQLEARAPRHDRPGKRAKYLPSEQVIEELGRLGPDLTTLAAELRNRLTESGLAAARLGGREGGHSADVRLLA